MLHWVQCVQHSDSTTLHYAMLTMSVATICHQATPLQNHRLYSWRKYLGFKLGGNTAGSWNVLGSAVRNLQRLLGWGLNLQGEMATW